MTITESVTINADMEKVWTTFISLACWKSRSAMNRVSAQAEQVLSLGSEFNLCLRPFALPLNFKPVIEELVPNDRVVWTASKLWVSAKHEFLFTDLDGAVLLLSRETFNGPLVEWMGRFMPQSRIRTLTIGMLHDLKKWSEDLAAGTKPRPASIPHRHHE